MGTSQSSKGPGAQVSLIPPWAEQTPESPEVSEGPEEPNSDAEQNKDPAADAESDAPRPDGRDSMQDPNPLAGDRRFASARRSLGSFAQTGNGVPLRRGLAQYVSKGYGGSTSMGRRISATSSTARALGRALDPNSADPGLDRTLLGGKSAEEVMDAVVEAARPHDGTLDAEAARAAIRDALSDLLGRFDRADLLQLTSEQREFAIERFTAYDVYRRFVLDVGKHLVDKAPNKTTALARLKQARDYIREVVAEAFRGLREQGRALTAWNVQGTVRAALADSLHVFEGYL